MNYLHSIIAFGLVVLTGLYSFLSIESKQSLTDSYSLGISNTQFEANEEHSDDDASNPTQETIYQYRDVLGLTKMGIKLIKFALEDAYYSFSFVLEHISHSVLRAGYFLQLSPHICWFFFHTIAPNAP